MLLCLTLACLSPAALAQPINEDRKLLASDGATNDLFGVSVAISSGLAAIGARWNDERGQDAGAVYVIDAATGNELHKLTATDGAAYDYFGHATDIDNNTVVAGSKWDDDLGTNSGSAYLFNATTGSLITKLLASDGAQFDQFGQSVAIADGIVVVGAPSNNGVGAAYLFNATTGQQIRKLTASDGEAGDEFGWTVAITTGIVAVGAHFDNDNGTQSGSVYLFDTATGQELHKVLPNDGAAGDQFGHDAISIDSAMLAVGAHMDDDQGETSGSAYLFSTASGTQLHKIIPADGGPSLSFGNAVALHNGVLAVGCKWDNDDAQVSGSAYLYDAGTGTLITKALPSVGGPFVEFGNSIALENSTLVVGAWADDSIGSNSGAAYVYSLPNPCPADLNGDGFLDNGDIGFFITLFLAGDLAADLNGDGFLDNGDIGTFITLFLAGC